MSTGRFSTFERKLALKASVWENSQIVWSGIKQAYTVPPKSSLNIEPPVALQKAIQTQPTSQSKSVLVSPISIIVISPKRQPPLPLLNALTSRTHNFRWPPTSSLRHATASPLPTATSVILRRFRWRPRRLRCSRCRRLILKILREVEVLVLRLVGHWDGDGAAGAGVCFNLLVDGR